MLRDDDLDPAKLKQPANIGRKKDYDPIKVLKFIAGRTKENPISTSEWSDLSGIGRTTLNGYISDLREAGLIASIGEGSHARKYVTEKGAKLLQNSTDGN
jgi:predicted transcriptional regulator